jgi:lipid-A-disaccharide synthase
VSLRIGIVVGEVSGDRLAADFIRAFKRRYPDVVIEGILGPALLKEGGRSLFPMERLSVMGLFEPLMRLLELIRIQRSVIQHFLSNPPDFFLGVDSPDFNLRIEKKLKAKGIPTIHYVSPSVWAWRQGRIKGIKQSVDLMLTLLPFEAQFYHNHDVPVSFIGHPLADQIPLQIEIDPLKKDKKIITLMPGSRNSEIRYLGETLLLTAKLCFEKEKNLIFLVPLVSKTHQATLEALQKIIAPELPIEWVIDNAREAIKAADVVLVTSGTATLEVMLHKKPMVVVYKMHPLAYQILKRVIKVPYISLPNLLANEPLVPEFIQAEGSPQKLAEALFQWLESPEKIKKLIERFTVLHHQLKQEASEKAVQAVLDKFSWKG